jgi:hypothetical protein
VRAFLEENTALVSSLAFFDIDMAEVLPQEPDRNKVRAARVAAAAASVAKMLTTAGSEWVRGSFRVLTWPAKPGSRWHARDRTAA